MLTITVPERELYDEIREEFVVDPAVWRTFPLAHCEWRSSCSRLEIDIHGSNDYRRKAGKEQ